MSVSKLCQSESFIVKFKMICLFLLSIRQVLKDSGKRNIRPKIQIIYCFEKYVFWVISLLEQKKGYQIQLSFI